jgi:hypothetical protein
MILFQCPVTGRHVESDIQTSAERLARLGELKISLWCSHCQEPHSLKANEITASLFGIDDTQPTS